MEIDFLARLYAANRPANQSLFELVRIAKIVTTTFSRCREWIIVEIGVDRISFDVPFANYFIRNFIPSRIISVVECKYTFIGFDG